MESDSTFLGRSQSREISTTQLYDFAEWPTLSLPRVNIISSDENNVSRMHSRAHDGR